LPYSFEQLTKGRQKPGLLPTIDIVWTIDIA
jgi:hypothetical protein